MQREAHTFSGRFSTVGRRWTRRTKEMLAAYILLAPAVLGLAAFVAGPMLYALWVSLHQWSTLSLQMPWVGLQNYVASFQDSEWLQSLGRTFLYTAIFVPVLFVLSLLLALTVQGLPHLKTLFRTLFFLPVVISPAISGVIWSIIYDPSGPIDHYLEMLGLQPVQWLGSTQAALYAVIIVSLWLGMGYYMVIFLAGLQDIPREYYEAAQLDGARRWDTFRFVTFPNLRHTNIFVLVVATIGSFQVFDQIMLMTGGGPASSTTLAVLYIFQQAFQQFQFGYAAALSFILFLIIFVFTIVQLRLLRVDQE